MTIATSDLAKFDFVLILDKSGSMGNREQSYGGKTRWEQAKETTIALATKISQIDADGIDVYVFDAGFKSYKGVTEAKVEEIFQENEPGTSTAMHKPLQAAIDAHFAKNGSKPTIIIVVTDGEPDDKQKIADIIIAATKKMTVDEDLGISFFQIGTNAEAAKYLKMLDDNLKGAKFDIVDAVTFEEMENKTFTEVLLNAIND